MARRTLYRKRSAGDRSRGLKLQSPKASAFFAAIPEPPVHYLHLVISIRMVWTPGATLTSRTSATGFARMTLSCPLRSRRASAT